MTLLGRTRDVLLSSEDGPGKPSVTYQRMATSMRLVEDLMGGTERMREASTDWLPQEDRESAKAYTARLSKSVLHPMFEDTVSKVSDAPFANPLRFDAPDDWVLPEMLQRMWDNADGGRRDITEFAHDVFKGAVSQGMRFILTDYRGTAGITLGEQDRKEIAPQLVEIRAQDFVGFEFSEDEQGNERLTEIRFREASSEHSGSTEAADKWAEEIVEYIRIVRPGTWELWKRSKLSGSARWAWAIVPGDDGSGVWTMAGVPKDELPPIPLTCFYTNQTGQFRAVPPLIGLGWLNVAHWQSYSDHRNHMRFIRVGIMYGAGATEEEIEDYGNIAVGSNRMLWFRDAEATVQHAAYQGSATQASREDLKDIEDRSEVLGMAPLVEKGVSSTATRANLDRERGMAPIKRWVRDFGTVLTECFRYAALWSNEELPEDFAIRVFSDFSIGFRTTDELTHLLKARMGGELSRQTYLREVQRRGTISTDVDLAEEVSRIEAEEEDRLKRADEMFAKENNEDPEDPEDPEE